MPFTLKVAIFMEGSAAWPSPADLLGEDEAAAGSLGLGSGLSKSRPMGDSILDHGRPTNERDCLTQAGGRFVQTAPMI